MKRIVRVSRIAEIYADEMKKLSFRLDKPQEFFTEFRQYAPTRCARVTPNEAHSHSATLSHSACRHAHASVGDTLLFMAWRRSGRSRWRTWACFWRATQSLGHHRNPLPAGLLRQLPYRALLGRPYFCAAVHGVRYVVVAFLAKYWQHETITVYRWLGILLIVCGVGFVATGHRLLCTSRNIRRKSTHPKPQLRVRRDDVSNSHLRRPD